MQNINPGLLKKYLNKSASKHEKDEVETWLNKFNLSAADVHQYLSNYSKFELYKQLNPEHDWDSVRNKIKSQKKTIALKYYVRVAASIAIIISVSAVVWQINNTFKKPYIISNYTNHVMKLVLPDSSVVSLNSNSKLTYFNSFSEKRELSLDGEAFFEVKRNIHNPFIIKTLQSNIKVLGTSFSVTTQKQNTSIVVASGRVAFYSTTKQCDTVYLLKGDKGFYNSEARCVMKQANTNTNFLSWNNHLLSFNNTPLQQVISDLETFYGVRITVKSPAIYKTRYTSEFKNPTLNTVIKEMELVLNIKTQTLGTNLIMTLK